jgi:hypothetical protein
VRVLVAANVAPSACAPLSPILLPNRSSVASDALLPTLADRCAAPAAVIPQDSQGDVVRHFLAKLPHAVFPDRTSLQLAGKKNKLTLHKIVALPCPLRARRR